LVGAEDLVPPIEVVLDEMGHCLRGEVDNASIVAGLVYRGRSCCLFIGLVEYFKHVLVGLFEAEFFRDFVKGEVDVAL